MGYWLGAVALSLAALWWRLLLQRLPGHTRAQAGFVLLTGALSINTAITVLICLAVISGAMPMTTPFFHRLMYGGWSAGIAVSGWMLLGLSLIIGWAQWRRGRLPRSIRQSATPSHAECLDIPGLHARFTEATPSLCLAGVWRPELWVNPRLWNELTPTERELAIAHELRHLERRDNLKRLALEALAALYFALPWGRHWAAQYELDSELAVDHACRQLDKATYPGLIARLTQRQLTKTPPRVTVSQLFSQAHTERLRALAVPPAPNLAPAALWLYAICGVTFSQALAVALLFHSVSRCLLTCYLGY